MGLSKTWDAGGWRWAGKRVIDQHWENSHPGWITPATVKPVQQMGVEWDGDPLGKAVAVPHSLFAGNRSAHSHSSHFKRETQGAVDMGWGHWSSLAWGHIWSSFLRAVMIHGARAAALQGLATLTIPGAPELG